MLAIDVGTNAVLGVVAFRQGDALEVRYDEERIVGLGRGVDRTGALDPARIEAALRAVRDHVEAAAALGVTEAFAVGTSALRDATNRDAFLTPAAAIVGRPIEVISGAREAALTFLGATEGLGVAGPRTVLDIGGGSTEVAVGDERGLSASTSLDIGSVRLFERCLLGDPPAASELADLDAIVAAALASAPAPRGSLVACAGTASAVAMLVRGRIERCHGEVLSRAQLEDVASMLARSSAADRRRLPGMIAARADVLVAGARILCAAARWAGVENVRISEGGVRFGVLRERLGL